MTTHYQVYEAADGTIWAACGLAVPSARQTKTTSEVTCGRCWHSEDFRKANARVPRQLDDPRIPPTPTGGGE